MFAAGKSMQVSGGGLIPARARDAAGQAAAMPETPRWLADAMTLPLAFAQVREDPTVDLGAIRLASGRGRVLMIASGGCSAAYLAARAGVQRIDLVDMNPAQLALTRLKLRWLIERPPRERRRLLGHAAMPADGRVSAVRQDMAALGIAADAFGPETVIADGLDHGGRYEHLFARLQARLRPMRASLVRLLALDEPARQRRALAGDLDTALKDAIADVMRQSTLVRLFGNAATANRRQAFARHFTERTRWALSNLPAAGNPWLAQMLMGGDDVPTAPWLALPRPARLPVIAEHRCDLATALARIDGTFTAIHCSNVLDWLAPDAAAEVLERCRRRLARGGVVIVRQLNSTLDLRACAPAFTWLPAGDRLHARERAFFYRSLHIGRA